MLILRSDVDILEGRGSVKSDVNDLENMKVEEVDVLEVRLSMF